MNRELATPLSQIRISLVTCLGAGQIVFLTGINATKSKVLAVFTLETNYASETDNPSSNAGKNNRFPFLDILGYLKDTHKNAKFVKVRQVPTGEFPTKFPDRDLSHSSKFGIFVGIL